MKHIAALTLFSLLFLIVGCVSKDQDATLRFQDADPKYKDFVSAYTAGVISKASSIRIVLTADQATKSMVGQPLEEGVFAVTPKLEGTAIWEDTRTILFKPNEWMESGKIYKANLNLGALYEDIERDLKTFSFKFQPIEQTYELAVRGLREQGLEDLSKMRIVGAIQTADVAKPEDVQQLLAVKQVGNQDLKIRWDHSSNQRKHVFEVLNVQRKATQGLVVLNHGNEAFGNADGPKQDSITIPDMEFKTLDAKIINEDDNNPYILVQYSSPLQQLQSLDGLIKLENNVGSSYLIDGNELRIYPALAMEGNYEVAVADGVRDVQGNTAPAASWRLDFDNIKPRIRAIGKGVILPQTEGLYFPFEAVNLKAVDVEVFRIYEDNVLQFLQHSSLNGSDYLSYVGRVVAQKRVLLQELKPLANIKQWTKYYLELDDLIEQEPGAIYQVRIGFQKAYTGCDCGDGVESDQLELKKVAPLYKEGKDGYYTSIFKDEYYWYGGTNDPCEETYYNIERFIQHNVLASNIGLIAKKGQNNELLVVATDILTAQPLEGANIELYDRQRRSVAKAATGKDGTLRIDAARTPYMVVATKGAQKGYLQLSGPLSTSNFEISGAMTEDGLKGKIYGERGVWRPGDSLYLTLVLEDKANVLPYRHPVTFKLYDPNDVVQQTYSTSDNQKGMYAFKTKTASSALTGTWRVEAHVGNSVFSEFLKIETVKPNRLKIHMEIADQKLTSADRNFSKDLYVHWLHGAPAKNARVKVDVDLSPMKTTFKEYKDFVFDDPARSSSSYNMFSLFDAQVDEFGYTKVAANFPFESSPAGFLRAGFTIRAFEKGGNASVDNFSVPFSPFTAYAGVQIPSSPYSGKELPMDEPSTVKVAAVGENGTPLANRNLQVGLYKVDWRWWWDAYQGDMSNFNTSTHLGAIETKTVQTNANGTFNWSVQPNEWGRYLVRVCDPESGHCSGDFFYAGNPFNEGDFSDKDAATMLAFAPDKEKYKIGEEVELQIPTGKEGRALVTIENGSKILEHFWVDVTDNEEGVQKAFFKTTKEMSPNVYAHVSLLQPHSQVENDLPIRSYGVVPIYVEDAETHLEPTLAMPEALRPNTTVDVKVGEANDKPMAYTLAVVDEGLLALTRYRTPDLWNYFYRKEALGVSTWDIYDYVLGAQGVELDRILTIGGGVDVDKEDEAKKANRFEPMVRFLGPFYLEKGQEATHSIEIPNYVGAVRVMVVAADDGAYGKTEKSVPVRQPLMVLGTLPRVLSPTESVALPVTVFSMEKPLKNVTVEVQANDFLGIKGNKSQVLNFEKVGEETIYFDLEVKDKLGIGRVTIVAKSGGESAIHEIELDVRNPNPQLSKVYNALVEAGGQWTMDIDTLGVFGSNQGVLEISKIPPLNLAERLDYLIQYPHGCVEQTTSSGFPQLFVSNLVPLDEKRKKTIEQNVKATIKRLASFQTALGGFSYWQGTGTASEWGTSYAGHFLLEAENKGYEVPKALLKKWIKYQKNLAKAWAPRITPALPEGGGYAYDISNDQLMQAYRLYTLALAESPDLGAMNRLLEQKNLAPVASWRLAAAYALVGRKQIAQRIIEKLPSTVPAYTERSFTFGSDLRDEAMILETQAIMGEQENAQSVLLAVAQKLSSDRWYATQSVAYGLLAVAKFVGDEPLTGNIPYTYAFGNQAPQQAALAKHPMMQYSINIDGMDQRKLSFENKSDNRIFVRFIQQGLPPLTSSEEIQSDLKIEVKYESLEGNPIDPTKMQQGVDFAAVVTVTNPGLRGDYKEMVLSQIFPSGWEILNTRMLDAFSMEILAPMTYQDVRDDRVYTYFDIGVGYAHTYKVFLNAAYKGKFYLPNTACEAMYDNTIYANSSGRWVEVVDANAATF